MTNQSEPRARVLPERFATQDLPGIGGVIKQRPEDFLVDEQPLYPPSGEGEHIYLFIEKRDLSTFDLVGVVADHFGVRRQDVGYAGLKDKHAITRQLISVRTPGKDFSDFPMLRHPSIGVQWADMHRNQLRPGHLAGNRFSIRVRGVSPLDARAAKRVLDRLETSGVPNRFGEQRFGAIWRNHLIGAADVLGDARRMCDALLGPCDRFPTIDGDARDAYAAQDYAEALNLMPKGARAERRVLHALADGKSFDHAIHKLYPRERQFFHSSMQSAAFNAVLDDRLREDRLSTLSSGDLAWKHDSGAVFRVTEENIDELQPRLDRFEISPSGPLWGAEMTRAEESTDRIEVEALGSLSLTPADLERADAQGILRLHGARRPLRVPLTNTEVEGGMDEHGAYVRCAFDLPPGSFATVVMREVMKSTSLDLSQPQAS